MRVLKWAGYGLGFLAIVVAGVTGWVELTWSVDHPDTPLPAVQASRDPAVIAEGEYLVHAVAHCSACHTDGDDVRNRKVDFTKPLTGGYTWEMGPLGRFTAANLTPHATGIGAMSDAEVARAIKHAVGRDGKLKPMMRFAVGPMADEDITAIVSWLRAQQPVESGEAVDEFGFLAKALSASFLPRIAEAPEYVTRGTLSVARGRYLAEGPAMCAGCHTSLDPMDGFAPVKPLFSGAGEAEPDPADPEYEFVSPNLTPDEKTGHITSWTEEQFVERFRAGRVLKGSKMPWESFQRLDESDVRSIYRFLRSLPPVENAVGPTYRKAGYKS